MFRFGWTRPSVWAGFQRQCGSIQRRAGTQETQDDSQPPDTIKLSKVMGMMGIASRRNAEKMIQEGQVQVANRVVKNVATRIFPYGTQITVNNRNVRRSIVPTTPAVEFFSRMISLCSTSPCMHGNGNLAYGFIIRYDFTRPRYYKILFSLPADATNFSVAHS